MPDVKSSSRGIRKHIQNILLWLGHVSFRSFESVVFFPKGLPLWFYFGKRICRGRGRRGGRLSCLRGGRQNSRGTCREPRVRLPKYCTAAKWMHKSSCSLSNCRQHHHRCYNESNLSRSRRRRILSTCRNFQRGEKHVARDSVSSRAKGNGCLW